MADMKDGVTVYDHRVFFETYNVDRPGVGWSAFGYSKEPRTVTFEVPRQGTLQALRFGPIMETRRDDPDYPPLEGMFRLDINGYIFCDMPLMMLKRDPVMPNWYMKEFLPPEGSLTPTPALEWIDTEAVDRLRVYIESPGLQARLHVVRIIVQMFKKGYR